MNGQDPLFILPNTNAGLLNPAAAGLNPNAYFQYQFNESSEQSLIGVGSEFKYRKQRFSLNIYTDNSENRNGKLMSKSFMASYAKDFPVLTKYCKHTQMHMGISAELIQKTFRGFYGGFAETLNKPNFSIGAILSHKNIFLGLAAHNILEPTYLFNQFGGEQITTHIRYIVNSGIRCKVYKELYITPTVLYQNQAQSEKLLPSIQVNCGPAILGVSKSYSLHTHYRNPFPQAYSIDWPNFFCGFVYKNIKISYAYGSDNYDTYYTHSFAITYYIKEKNKTNFSDLMRGLL